MGDKTMRTEKRGFTLIELIVVIAILAILAFLIVPKVTGYVDQANDMVAKGYAKTCYNEYLAWKAAKESGLNNDTRDCPNNFIILDINTSTDAFNPKLRTKGCYYIDYGPPVGAMVIGPTVNTYYYGVSVLDGTMYQVPQK